jgi:hypothetical protein
VRTSLGLAAERDESFPTTQAGRETAELSVKHCCSVGGFVHFTVAESAVGGDGGIC